MGTLRTATLETEGRQVQCVVRDISGGGARLKLFGHGVGTGATGSLAIPGVGAFEGVVAWCQGEELGLRFAEEAACEPFEALETSDISDVLGLVAKQG